MAKKPAGETGSDSGRTNQIVGVRMTPEMAAAFKAEAEKRSISLRKLFEEMWSNYTSKKS